MEDPCPTCDLKGDCLNVQGERHTGKFGACGPYNQWIGYLKGKEEKEG